MHVLKALYRLRRRRRSLARRQSPHPVDLERLALLMLLMKRP